MKLSVIIACHNEAGTIENIIRRVKAVVLPDNIFKEIIIVDDFSTDGSRDILEKLKNEKEEISLKIVYHEKNKGKGAALKSGIKEISGDFTVIQDADVELDPNDYNKLIEPIISGKADMVVGHRFTEEFRKNMPKKYAKYYWANRLITSFLNLLFFSSFHDVNCGYKMFKSEVIKNLNVRSDSFEIEVEIIAKVLKIGYKIKEVPVNYTPREKREGKKIKLKHAFMMFWAMLKYRFFN